MFDRFFKKKKIPKDAVNVLTPIDPSRGLHIVNRATQIKYRVSKDVPPELTAAIQSVCAGIEAIQTCFLLDVEESPTLEIKLFIDLRLQNDDASSHFIQASEQIQGVLKAYPDIARKSYISSSHFEIPAERAIYQRTVP
jgi:hypothetical protein